MPHRRRRRGRKTKFVTKRSLPFQMMKYVETKFFDNVQQDITAVTPVPVGPQFQAINLMNQGSDTFNREGNMVQQTGLYARFILESALSGTNQWLRIAFVTPRITNSISFPLLNMTTAIDTDTHIVWYDKVHNCAFQPGGGNGVVTVRKKFKPYMKQLYDNLVMSSIQKGSIQIAILPQNTGGVVFSYTVRTYFKDM